MFKRDRSLAMKTLKSVENALDILELFSSRDKLLSLRTISEKTGLHKSTTYRLVWVLRSRGYIEKDENTGHYGLGFQLIELASSHINDLELLTEAKLLMFRLYAEVCLTVQFCILDKTEVVYLEEVNSFIMRKYSRMGFKGPAYCSSLGKCLLSGLSGDTLNNMFEGYKFIRYTDTTLTCLDQLKEELKIVRERGWARNNGERASRLSSIAAPIFDYNGDVVAAVSIGAPTPMLTDEKIQEVLPNLLATAEAISKRLGYMS
jgi:DNA-binding IclR family transcriptional regulator